MKTVKFNQDYATANRPEDQLKFKKDEVVEFEDARAQWFLDRGVCEVTTEKPAVKKTEAAPETKIDKK